MLRTLLPLLALLPAPAALSEPLTLAAPPLLPYEALPAAGTHPSLYSFAEAYRLALSGERVESLCFAAAPSPVRMVAQTGGGAASEPRFSVSAPRDGGRWPLVLAGLFACAWVAHRRLTSPY